MKKVMPISLLILKPSKRLLKLTGTLEDLCRHQTVWVFGVFDEKDLFAGFLARQMQQKRVLKERPKGVAAFSVHAETDVKVIHGDQLALALLPFAERPDELADYHRLVGVRGDRKIRQTLKVNTGRINPQHRLEQVELATLQLWLSHGNVPLGTYVDEVVEPDFACPESEDGISVLS